MAKAVVEALKLEDRVVIVLADATSYEPEENFDLVVSETMDAGLLSDPMCEILANLKKFTKEGAKILPEKVSVYGAVTTSDQFFGAD